MNILNPINNTILWSLNNNNDFYAKNNSNKRLSNFIISTLSKACFNLIRIENEYNMDQSKCNKYSTNIKQRQSHFANKISMTSDFLITLGEFYLFSNDSIIVNNIKTAIRCFQYGIKRITYLNEWHPWRREYAFSCLFAACIVFGDFNTLWKETEYTFNEQKKGHKKKNGRLIVCRIGNFMNKNWPEYKNSILLRRLLSLKKQESRLQIAKIRLNKIKFKLFNDGGIPDNFEYMNSESNNLYRKCFNLMIEGCNNHNNNEITNIITNIVCIKECNWKKCKNKKKKLKKCKKCLSVFYCSKLCQKRDWTFSCYNNKPHQYYCKPLKKRDYSITIS